MACNQKPKTIIKVNPFKNLLILKIISLIDQNKTQTLTNKALTPTSTSHVVVEPLSLSDSNGTFEIIDDDEKMGDDLGIMENWENRTKTKGENEKFRIFGSRRVLVWDLKMEAISRSRKGESGLVLLGIKRGVRFPQKVSLLSLG